MKSIKRMLLAGGCTLSLLAACNQDSSTTAQTEAADLTESTATELADGHVDGVEGMGPRPRHALIMDCSAEPPRPEGGGMGPQGPGRPSGEDGAPPARPAGEDGGPPARPSGEGGGPPARPAGEDGAPPARPSGEVGDRPERAPRGFLRLYDLDDSGTLDETERAAAAADRLAGCEARNARLLAAYDADGDGALSDAELEVAQAAIDAEMEARRAEAIATYDADGDGELDETERQTMRDAKHAELIAQFDVDGDGALDESEEDALAESIKAAIRDGTAHRFGRGPGHR